MHLLDRQQGSRLTATKPEILLADDERVVRDGLKALLGGEGFSVRTARNGEDALAKFAEHHPDLVVLDVMMPKLNGFSVCEEIRRRDRLVPVIFLTAKDGDVDQVRGMGLGADDYVSKAADTSVLLARVKRALARGSTLAALTVEPHALCLGSVTIDFARNRVTSPEGEATLTVTEREVLRCLVNERGKTLTADEILSELRGVDYIGDPSSIRVHVLNLRRKLGPAGDLIVTIKGNGYYLVK